ncbi:AF4/FMR2 family member 4 isoform X2 [Drosophila pseudoobscura]|uniref:AF4/FMR2 family member 4 isoform X2 n=1 Tax=Drosophila pseudoobscura pseudoobscura TaxID=46245 RepID=A0A6I8VRQ4_DROPS|nr:AF4/FMR2 family member 4 isoform X2 [Drosophila pseudoobscura]
MTADPISLCFWICLQPDRYVPGSPIFRDSSPARPATSASGAPITAAPAPTTSRSRTKAMTAAVTNAAQGRGTNSNSNAIKSRPPTCYMSTRSAAMMALTLGQTSGGSSNVKSSSAQQTSTPVLPQAVSIPRSSPRPTNRNVPNVASPTSSASRSKPSTPTATRAAVAAALNGGGIFSGGSNSSGSDNDGFSTSGSSTATALRRLYFKSGRSIKNKINASTSSSTATTLNGLALNPVSSAYHNSVSGCGPAMHSVGVGGGVPKLVVMGTSSASIPDTNINTSTDSASTLITNVTHTDTSETCDSLDLGDNSGPSEPLFSSLEEPLLTAIQIDSEHETGGCGSANGRRGVGTELELTSCSRYPPRPDMNLQDSTESQESCLSILTGDQSSTTPLLSSQRRQAAGGHSPGSRREERQPSTAPPPTRARDHFTFDPPLSPKSARSSEKARSHFPFKDEPRAQAQAQAQAQQTRRGYNSHNAGSTNGAAGKGVGAGTEGGIGPGGGGGRTVAASEGDEEDDERSGASAANRNKKLRPRERDPNANDSSRTYISPGVSPSNSRRSSPKRDKKRTTPSASTGAIAKVCSAPPTMKDGHFFSASGKQQHQQQHQNQRQTPQQLSPSSSMSAQQRKYSSSSSSGSSERCLRELAAAPGTMFPFDREALDHERIQRECFARSSSTASASSDSDEAENRSVYERKLGADIFQQYSRLTQQEQLQQQQQQREWERDRPPSRKNSKRIRPDSVIHTTIRENQQYVPQSDAFYPQAKSSSSPSDHSYAELNKFDDIANKFEQIPPKHGSSSTLNLHMPSPGSDSGQQALSPTTDATRKRSFKSKSKNRPKGDYGFQLEERGAGPINVTANPMEAAAVCKQPRATIVVQQPSLSLDSTVETLLIKNEGDFISVEQGKELNARKRNSQQLAHAPTHSHHHHSHHQQQEQQHQQHQQQKQQHHHHPQQHKRDENMRQLLDVTNTLTIEELRDFEMRYGSPHHSRSQSVKMPGSRASGRPNQLCLPQQRSRVASMPNTGVEEEYYRLRHFSITGKGVVNRGDSLKSRRSRSNNSVASSNSSTEHLTAQQQQLQLQLQQQQQQQIQQLPAPTSSSARTSLASSRESSTSNPGNGPYRVLMLGGPAVGKSSLVSQFMTSEYLHAYDTSIDDESGEKAVSVLLSGEESELIFIDHGYTEMTPDECLTNYDPHGYCVIYSAADRSSFTVAEQVLQVLWTNQNIAQKAVILVSNKSDLARSRLVTSEEGKAMATAYDCKFIETSVGINHNVDELLVGLLSQIRLKLENPEKSRDLFRKRSIRKSKRRACSPLNAGCLNANSPLGPLGGPLGEAPGTPPGSSQSSPRKYRGSRTSTSLKVKGLLGRVWTRDSKSKSCENLHVL